jgi:predicted RNase H-like HicB family nuclease/uncharacterized protein (DUF1778 family)
MSEFRRYIAVVERNKTGRFFAHVPDLPGVTAGAKTVDDVLSLLADFADDYVRDLANDGHDVPSATAWERFKPDPEVKEFLRAIVPVRLPSKASRSVKISLSIDEEVLERIDRAAQREGESRSGFFASAASERATKILAPPSMTQEDMVHAIEKAGGLSAVLEEAARRSRRA